LRLNRDSERIPRRLRGGLASELKIDLHPYGAAQHCRFRQNISRGLPRGEFNPKQGSNAEKILPEAPCRYASTEIFTATSVSISGILPFEVWNDYRYPHIECTTVGAVASIM